MSSVTVQPISECTNEIGQLLCVEFDVAFTVDAECEVVDVKCLDSDGHKECRTKPKDEHGRHHSLMIIVVVLLMCLISSSNDTCSVCACCCPCDAPPRPRCSFCGQ